MLYGPRTADVQAFINSLPTLSRQDWDAGMGTAIRSVVGHDAATDTAHIEIVAAANRTGLRQEQAAAQRAAQSAVESLPWGATEHSLKLVAHIAAGAIVVLDAVSLEKLTPAFLPFRNTTVELPVTWN